MQPPDGLRHFVLEHLAKSGRVHDFEEMIAVFQRREYAHSSIFPF